jgi:hypothetical protein
MASNGAQLASLRGKEHFPAFEDLAWDNHLNPEYYRERHNGFWEPRKHWVFLGQIVKAEIDLRVRLVVKDRDGQELPVAIYTERRGVEISPSNLQVGNTVVIFYAVKHAFLDLTMGIRHEDLEYLKVRYSYAQLRLLLTPTLYLDLPDFPPSLPASVLFTMQNLDILVATADTRRRVASLSLRFESPASTVERPQRASHSDLMSKFRRRVTHG